MPEGHTIHRQVVDQAPLLVGRSLRVESPNRRFESGAADLDGRTLEAVEAWGKHLFYFFGDRRVLHVHLGMEGRFHRQTARPGGPGRARPGTWLRIGAPELSVDLQQPKVCELIDVVTQRRIVDRLGPDPIRTDDDGGAWERLRLREGPIGAALLDQSLVAGIGNVYRAEILFACRVHPERPAAAVSRPEWDGIWASAVRMLREGVRNRGQIVTVPPGGAPDRRRTSVYGQRVCARCGRTIRVWVLAGRVAYACEGCQPP